MHAEIAEAGSVSAWIHAGKSSSKEERARKPRMNALAEKCGMARLYPEIDTRSGRKCNP